MKRIISIFLSVVLCVLALLPVAAHAQTFTLSDTDLRIDVDDSMWYVFTRDNIENNPEMEELGITYESIYDILYENQAYMDAVLVYDDGGFMEFFVRKKALDSGVANLSNYEDDEVQVLGKELAKKLGSETFSLYENQYKYVKLDYFDQNAGYYICEYITVVNKDNYTFTFQAPAPFTDWEYEEIKKIVDSAVFDVDPSIKEETGSSGFERIVVRTIAGGTVGGVAGLMIALVNKKKKKQREEDPPFAETKEM